MNRKFPFRSSPYTPPLERFSPGEREAPGNSAFSLNPPRRQFNEFHAPERSAPFSSGYSHTDQLYRSARPEPFYSQPHSQTKNISHIPHSQEERKIPHENVSNYSGGYSYSQTYRAAEMNTADTSDYYNYEPGAETSTRNHSPTNHDSVPVEQNQTKVQAHKCEICNGTFFARKSLNRHIRLHHTNNGPPIKVSCDKCGKQFKNNHRLFKHQRDSHGMHGRNKPEDNFDTNSFPNDSKVMVTSELSTNFLHPTSTSDNVSTNPDAGMSSVTEPVGQNKKKERPHKCESCKKSFFIRRSLETHIRLRHTQRHTINDPRIIKVSCDICGKQFKKNDRLFRHQKDSHGMHGRKKTKENTNVPKLSVTSGVENPSEISEVQNPPEESEVQEPAEKSEDQKDSSDTNLFTNDPK